MANIFEDTLNFGFGLFAYSREKIEEMVEKMVEKGQVERTDARTLARDLTEKGDAERKEIKKMIQTELKSTMEGLGLTRENQVTKDDIREIIREELAKK